MCCALRDIQCGCEVGGQLDGPNAPWLFQRSRGHFQRTGRGTDYGLHTKLGDVRVEFGGTGSAGPASGRSEACRCALLPHGRVHLWPRLRTAGGPLATRESGWRAVPEDTRISASVRSSDGRQAGADDAADAVEGVN